MRGLASFNCRRGGDANWRRSSLSLRESDPARDEPLLRARHLQRDRRMLRLSARRQVLEHDLTGALGLDKRAEGRTADFDGGPVLMGRTPRNHKAGISMKAGTTAALIADHEGKAAAASTPDLNVPDRSGNAIELHASLGTARISTPAGVDIGVASRKMQAT